MEKQMQHGIEITSDRQNPTYSCESTLRGEIKPPQIWIEVT